MNPGNAVGWVAVVLSGGFGLVGLGAIGLWMRARIKPAQKGNPDAVLLLKPMRETSDAALQRVIAWKEVLSSRDRLIVATGPLDPVRSAQWNAAGGVRNWFGKMPDPDLPNPKMAQLATCPLPAAQDFPRWAFCDEDVLASPELMRVLWSEQSAGVLSFPYRTVGANSLAAHADRAAQHVGVWPGCAILRAAGTPPCLGALMLVRREYVESMGGMRFLGQWLAEDAVLGEQVRTLGGRIELSPHIVELEAASMRWGDWWRRQRRLAVTYKIVARGGYFGSILVMPGAWAWLLLAMGRVDWAMGVLAFRALSLCGGLVFFKEQAKGHLALVLPLVMMMEPIFWALAWLRGGSVVWGKSRKVDEDGRLN